MYYKKLMWNLKTYETSHFLKDFSRIFDIYFLSFKIVIRYENF